MNRWLEIVIILIFIVIVTIIVNHQLIREKLLIWLIHYEWVIWYKISILLHVVERVKIIILLVCIPEGWDDEKEIA